MGRVVGYLASAVYALRLLADLALIGRDLRAGRATAEPVGAPDVGGPAEAMPADRPGGVGPAGAPAGPTARAGADPLSGPASRG